MTLGTFRGGQSGSSTFFELVIFRGAVLKKSPCILRSIEISWEWRINCANLKGASDHMIIIISRMWWSFWFSSFYSSSSWSLIICGMFILLLLLLLWLILWSLHFAALLLGPLLPHNNKSCHGYHSYQNNEGFWNAFLCTHLQSAAIWFRVTKVTMVTIIINVLFICPSCHRTVDPPTKKRKKEELPRLP